MNTPARNRLAGLYVITDPALLAPERLVAGVASAIAGGARVIQYRDKSTDAGRRHWEAQDLVLLCRPLGVPLLINDDVELAAAVGADGVHLGQADTSLRDARARLGKQAIIGATCHGSLALARAAVEAGADYVAFGRFFPSRSKPQAPPADVGLLREARRQVALPIVAIGGITPENGSQLVAAGADMIAAINGVFGEADVKAAAARYAALFDRA